MAIIITGIIDGPRSGGVPKAIELTVTEDIADLSIYGIGSANNGGGSDGEEFTFSAVSASAGDKIYIASETPGFEAFFGFAPDYTTSAASINGDDAIELFQDGAVIDVFGDIDVDGTNQPWEYLDGWAYRADDSSASTTFDIADWTFSGKNALDGESSNADAGTPFPIGTYVSGPPAPELTISDASVIEGDDGETLVELTVTLAGAASGPFTVDFDTADGTATAGEDYVAQSGVLSFAGTQGETRTITVAVAGDEVSETAESLSVVLSGITGTTDATIAKDTGTLTIENDDYRDVLISEIQGSGSASEIEGDLVTIEGVVTGVYVDGMRGFYVQEEKRDQDHDASTSEGIFVYAPNAVVSEGDLVSVSGTVDEFYGLTQLTSVAKIDVLKSDVKLPKAISVELPLMDGESFEALEGMRVTFEQELTITQLFNYERYGEVQLSTQGQVPQFTQIHEPDPDGYAAWQAQDLATRIILDDGSTAQNPDELPFLDVEEFGAGDTITGLTGVMSYSFGDWKLQPTEAVPVEFENTNPREEAPADVGGDVKVASFNVLNYFTTLDDGSSTVNGQDPRGANSEAELARQTSKIVAALDALDADVVGLIEIENDDGAATDALVAALNAVSDRTYAAVDTGVIGTDAIKVAFIYDTETMKIADGTSAAILDTDAFVAPLETGPKNRPALAVTFEEKATGEQFTAVNNHLKSKGSPVDGDPNLDDGQGNGALTRKMAADELVKWLATNPTGTSDADQLILGDLNAYAKEDPIDEIKAGADDMIGTADDFTDLATSFLGEEAYSYRFSGQWGTLDYALANQPLLESVTGVTEWHINSDEPSYLSYNDNVLDPEERSFQVVPDPQEALFDADSPFASSDHDPILVGLDLDGYDNRFAGTDRNDRLTGTGERDLIEGLGGNDRLRGAGGDDDIDAGAGNDRAYGGAGDDLLMDGAGNDRLYGGAGDDTFEIGGGKDRAWTGSGADTIIFAAGLADDGSKDKLRIRDFDTEMDLLDLQGIEIEKVRESKKKVTLTLEGDGDRIELRGVSDFDDIQFADDTFAFV
ncbi:extracellular nuclease [Oceanicola granulosus HTCC2516]|uniref:Extracellular nuclease n=1 Tax=Oceanicola granulosus (strain ATCC BAA-861 / DSM 15982 / KCTC 12143 / HTCC2516) TaxID=314256 RepID=Q2CE70_OCEGH|nr:ExeM/NucH family extracellular endonuclease [Oceanicola granulosus]EAR50990.1 extracellular nuclease [Oceanicola granulosus HTCC2516]